MCINIFISIFKFLSFGRCSLVNNMRFIKYTIHNSYSHFTPGFLRAVRRGAVQDLVKWLTQNSMFLLAFVHTCSHSTCLPSEAYIVNNHSRKHLLKRFIFCSCVLKAFWIIRTKKINWKISTILCQECKVNKVVPVHAMKVQLVVVV
jgi:hypothetical protein